MQTNKRIHVAVAVVTDRFERILLTLRPKSVHQGGLWEFPGGKLEPNEGIYSALSRELREEIGINITSARPFIQIAYDYPTQMVLLDVYKVLGYDGNPIGIEGQEIRWVPLDEINKYQFPAANQAILRALLLPDRYLITPAPDRDRDLYFENIHTAIRNGIQLIQFRAKELEQSEYTAMAKRILEICCLSNTKLLLNSNPEILLQVGAHGLHLNSTALMASHRRPLDRHYLVGASCHDALELRHAEKIGLDFAVVSPVLPTVSHPNMQPLGWDKFNKLVSGVSIPVYALGGMSNRHQECAFQYGAQGIAAISGLWGACE